MPDEEIRTDEEAEVEAHGVEPQGVEPQGVEPQAAAASNDDSDDDVEAHLFGEGVEPAAGVDPGAYSEG